MTILHKLLDISFCPFVQLRDFLIFQLNLQLRRLNFSVSQSILQKKEDKMSFGEYAQELIATANYITQDGKGILASDESTGKRFSLFFSSLF